jgi:hypothetical protein
LRADLRIRARYASFLLPLLILPCALATAGHAAQPQSSSNSSKHAYALIYGTVWGPGDRPVAGVPIKIRRSTDKKAKWELVSDRSGEFAQRVPVGKMDYIVEADIKTPKGKAKPQVTAHVDDDEREDISLHLTAEELAAH